MRGYNIVRPLMLIIVALLTNMLVTNLCLMFGMASDAASNIGMIGMIIAALVMYNRFNKRGRKR